MFKFYKILKFIQTDKGSILTTVLIVVMSLFMLSACAPFQLNLPGSCSIFSNPEKSTQNHNQDPGQKKKKWLFEK